MSTPPAAAQVLIDFVPTTAFFVGIDSDGCAFDAMDIKHQECFTPTTIKHWNLQAASTLARETAIFVNLGSTTRGQNRWIALARVFELLAQRGPGRRRAEGLHRQRIPVVGQRNRGLRRSQPRTRD